MFCEKCNNFMDITSNVSDESSTQILEGGNSSLDISDSSDYNTISDDTLPNEVISDILSGKNITINLTEKLYNNLNKNFFFNKLSNNDKTLVLNRLYEKLPKNSKIFKTQSSNRPAYFYCKNCGFNFKIKNETFIFSRNKNNDNELFNTNILLNKYDSTLPYTKDYTCINKKCPTHTNSNIKKATFYRKNNTYNIKYICTVCDSFWNNI